MRRYACRTRAFMSPPRSHAAPARGSRARKQRHARSTPLTHAFKGTRLQAEREGDKEAAGREESAARQVGEGRQGMYRG